MRLVSVLVLTAEQAKFLVAGIVGDAEESTIARALQAISAKSVFLPKVSGLSEQSSHTLYLGDIRYDIRSKPGVEYPMAFGSILTSTLR